MDHCGIEDNLVIFYFGSLKSLVCLISHKVGDHAYCSFPRNPITVYWVFCSFLGYNDLEIFQGGD